MKRLFKVEAFQFIINPSLWAILGVLVAGAAFSALLGTIDAPAAALYSAETDGMMLPLALAVYGPLVTGNLSGSLTRRWAAAGFKRTEILTAKLCHLLLGCAVLLALYPLLALLSAAILQNPEGLAAAMIGALRYSLRAFPLCSGLCGLLRTAAYQCGRYGRVNWTDGFAWRFLAAALRKWFWGRNHAVLPNDTAG